MCRCFVWSGIFLVCLMVDQKALHWHCQGGLCRLSVPVLCRIELLDTSIWHKFLLCWPLLFLVFSLMYLLKVRFWSRNHPRYLTTLLTAIRSPWASVGSCDVFLSCCQEPKRMYSVLSGFSLRHIISIHCFRCVNVFSRSVLTLCSCSLSPALKMLYMEWSSANAVSVMELSI